LLAFVLGAYSSAVFVIAQSLTESAGKWTQFAVLLIAFSFDPLRRFLEKKIDGFLFGQDGAAPEDGRAEKPRPGRRKRGRTGSRWPLALVFPWRP